MTTTKHTPGPWMADHHPINGNIWVTSQSVDVAACSGDDATGKANAALIAAAPDLLAAAHLAADIFRRAKWLPGGTDPEAVALSALLAAIAKAEGRAP